MNALQRIAAGLGRTIMRASGTDSPWDDYWYSDSAGGPSLQGGHTLAGVPVTSITAANCNALMSCVRLMARTMACLPIHLLERQERGSRPATDHPLYGVLSDAANPRLGADEFVEIMDGHVELRGNAFAQIIRNVNGNVVELWPLHPDRVVVAVIAGEIDYSYRQENGKYVHIPTAEMFTVRGFGTDGVTGTPPYVQHAQEIGLTIAAVTYSASHFGNGGEIPYVIKYPGRFKDEAAFDEYIKNWNRSHKGPYRSGRVSVLENGADIAKIGVTPEEAQNLGTQEHNLEEMARIVGYIPMHLLNSTSKSTSWGTGIETQNIAFIQYGLLPRERRWEKAISLQLLTPAERGRLYAKFRNEALLRGDATARASFFTAMRRLGAYNADDILELDDRNPKPNGTGQTYWEPLDMRIVDADGNVVYDPKAASVATPGTGASAAFRGLLHTTLVGVYQCAITDWPGADNAAKVEKWQGMHAERMNSRLAPVLAAITACGLELHDIEGGLLTPDAMAGETPDATALAVARVWALLGD